MPSDVRDAGKAEGVRVLLVRHGETIWNQENRWQGQADTPLSQTGYDQTRQLARRFRNEERCIQAIYTSDLQRARGHRRYSGPGVRRHADRGDGVA